jgi:hypothetical protein
MDVKTGRLQNDCDVGTGLNLIGGGQKQKNILVSLAIQWTYDRGLCLREIGWACGTNGVRRTSV